jgi:hypothetical protein
MKIPGNSVEKHSIKFSENTTKYSELFDNKIPNSFVEVRREFDLEAIKNAMSTDMGMIKFSEKY